MIPQRAVLGIDAAWTHKNPSGIALVCEESGDWSLEAVAGSYRDFVSLTDVAPANQDEQSNLQFILDAVRQITSCQLCMVAVDMPLANSQIVRRRHADNIVSKNYGRFGCGTHTPTSDRPGKISSDLRAFFEACDFKLRTSNEPEQLSLIEVYPHPALVVLTNAEFRLPYKVGKIREYWKQLSSSERRQRLLLEWSCILEVLKGKIKKIEDHLIIPPVEARTNELKQFEDMLDAVICAWVGVCALQGRATPYGDDDSAIWVPDWS